MMARKEVCSCTKMIREDRVLDDGFSYHYFQCEKCGRVDYPICQAQKLMDYADSHLFMFIDDWILAWMFVGDGAPILGIVKLQKELFIILKEFAPENNIPSENPDFRAYKFGPYTERIDRSIQTLIEMGLVSSYGRINSNNESFFLTESGKTAGEKALSKLTSVQIEKLKKLKGDLQQFSTDGIMTYVYSKYPEYTDKSIVLERVLHRKRNK